MALLSILLATGYGAVVASEQAATNASHGFEAQGAAQVGMNNLTTLIRAAVEPTAGDSAFRTAGPTSLSFYDAVGSESPQGPPLVVLSLTGTAVTETVTQPEPAPAPPLDYNTTPVTHVVASDVTGLALTYFTRSLVPLSPGSDGLTSTQLAEVTYVGITLTTAVGRTGPPVTFASRVLVRNVYYSFGSSQGGTAY